jgi:hypothetical protein
VDIRYTFITRRRWLNEDTGQVVYRDWNLVADNSGNTGVRVFFKEINRFQPNDCNAILSLWVTGKKLQNQYKDFLSDFKI